MELLERKFEKIGESNFKIIESRKVQNTIDVETALKSLIKGRHDILNGRKRIEIMCNMYNADIDMLNEAKKNLKLDIVGIPEKLNVEEIIGTYVEPKKETLGEKIKKVSESK